MRQFKRTCLPTLLVLLFLPYTAGRAQNGDGHLNPAIVPELETYLSATADSGFAFSTLIAINGRIILQRGYGWMDSARTRRTNAQTLFNLASITKSFTATCVCALHEKHLLNFNDTLPQFFSGVPEDKRSISILHLLTHSSGLGQHYLADGVTSRDSAVSEILSDSLKFPPGAGFLYSNENYELLAAIIEVVTRQTFESAVQQTILSKADLADTRFWDGRTPRDIENTAVTKRQLDSTVLRHNWGYIGSGGLWSNVTDLYRWFTALKAGTIVRPESFNDMTSVHLNASTTGIGLGWFISSSAWGREVWTRGTEDWGHNGVLRWFPDRNVVVIVQSNSGERGSSAQTANRMISDRILAIIFQ